MLYLNKKYTTKKGHIIHALRYVPFKPDGSKSEFPYKGLLNITGYKKKRMLEVIWTEEGRYYKNKKSSFDIEL